MQIYPLKHLGDLIENFDARRRPVKAIDRRAGPYPYYGAQGIVDYVSDYLFDGEFVLVAEDGENLRSRKEPVALRARGRFWVNNHAHILKGNAQADTDYLFYAINDADISGYVTGSTIPKLSQANLHRIFVPCPTLSEQRAIARMLGSLDDKIELNRRMNETLEAMARAIFKDWFVDFGPTRAKAEGRPPYLAPDLWLLFPSRLDDEGKPDGWWKALIGDLCSRVANGGTPSRSVASYWDAGTVPWLTSGEVRRPWIVRTDNYISELGLQNSSAKWVQPGATVVALYGATAGQVSLVATRLTTNQAVCALEPNKYFEHFIYLALSRSTETLAGMARGSAQQNLSKALVEEFPVISAGGDLMKSFDAKVRPLFSKIIANENECETLAQTRNLLLPKLMSGEMRIRDAERAVEAAA